MVGAHITAATSREEKEILRVRIDGEWTAPEFEELFSSFNLLNGLAQVGGQRLTHQSHAWLETLSVPDSDFERFARLFAAVALKNIFSDRNSFTPLTVSQVKFASPGFTDLGGVGKVLKEIRLFVKDILDRRDSQEDRHLAREEKKQLIMQKKIANAERLIKLSDKMGMDRATVNALAMQAIDVDDFIERQIEHKTPFIVVELGVDTDRFMLYIYTAVAENDRRMIGRRTKEALAAKKAQGVSLGGANAGTMGRRLRPGSARTSFARSSRSYLPCLPAPSPPS
jgi:hypothetical protein